MPSDSFSEALEQLDPASRALLDLSLRRGMRTEEIAEVLGAEPDSVAESRDEALRRVAEHVGMGGRHQRDEVRARLAELPPEEWLGPAARVNGHAVAEAQPEAEAEAEAEALPSRRRVLPILLLLALAIAAIVVIALASGGGGSTGNSAKAPAPKAKPAPPAKPAKSTKPAPQPKPPRPKRRGVKIKPMGGSEARGSVSLAGHGKRIRLTVRGLRSPGRASYQVWLYNSVIDARRIAKSRRVPLRITRRLPAKWRRYRFVDVSLEPADGNPNPSGRSVARVPTSKLR